MFNSTAGGALTDQQRQELNALKLIWEKFYAVSFDGARWAAVPVGEGDVLYADNTKQLRHVLMMDCASRMSGNGHWVETASGPPYFVESSRANGRDLRG